VDPLLRIPTTPTSVQIGTEPVPVPGPARSLKAIIAGRSGMEILVVDDDQMFREELAELLKGDGHQVSVAPSVPKALEELARKDYEMVLTDLKMPRHSGLELLEEVRKRWPRTLVVMITGYATVETAVQAMKSGAFDYIRKPFQIPQVRQVLDLAQQELEFQGGGGPTSNPGRLASSWVEKDHMEVLWITPRTVKPMAGVTVFSSRNVDPARVREVVESFVGGKEHAGVILENVEAFFEGRRKQDVLDFLVVVRSKMEGRGPLVVTADPGKLSASDLSELRAAIIAPVTHATLEALANPLRRGVLRRAAQGPCSFTQAMAAVGIDDSPKLSFHLRKLVEEGLLVHQGEDYRITPKGRELYRVLEEIDALSPGRGPVNAVLAARPASPAGPAE
jgi:CheY-like chemotaxis protein/predicted transcriptional regulator